MTARALVHVGLAGFGVFTAVLNAVGPRVAVAYLVGGAAAGPAVARFLTDRRKLLPGYYGSPPAPPGPAWCPPVTVPPVGLSARQAKLWRLANDPRAPEGERAAARAAFERVTR